MVGGSPRVSLGDLGRGCPQYKGGLCYEAIFLRGNSMSLNGPSKTFADPRPWGLAKTSYSLPWCQGVPGSGWVSHPSPLGSLGEARACRGCRVPGPDHSVESTGAAGGGASLAVVHVLHANPAPHAHHEGLDLALVAAPRDAEVAVLSPVLAPGVGSDLPGRRKR